MSELALVKLAEYTPPAFTTDHHELHFTLNDGGVLLRHTQNFRRIEPKEDEIGWRREQVRDLVLDGEGLDLQAIRVDGETLPADAYRYENNQLTLFNVADSFTLETEVQLQPDANRELSGLYRSNGIYCTQCEAQGFRRISFALDRPDVLATYRVHIEADRAQNPVLLANGDLEKSGNLGEARHYAQWYDPHPKPTYLFALVAGDLAMVNKRITTPLGKQVELRIYTEAPFIDQTDFAMQSLVESIHWDEKRFGLSYDLQRFHIVAISDFNMGAMENKGLNIFNTKYVIANTDTGTDADFHGIRAVIGHEYFHNWTGNRITCRDWFQLSLKEGLTVFRDQEFSADLGERALERIANVNLLRRVQFAEDAGPMRHPVQPQEYAAIDNFYTATVYEKGAEIIRMYHTILGEERFQQGMKRYVEKHDGQAVRIEDFAACMSEVSDYDFTGDFFRWYTTAGTPRVRFTSAYNQRSRSYTLAAGQDVDAVSPPRALVIPVKLSLINRQGQLFRFADGSSEQTLILDKPRASWTFDAADTGLIPVLMQDFSAPVYYQYDYDNEELALLAAHAPDGFARLEAIQHCYRRLFETAMRAPRDVKTHVRSVADIMLDVLTHDKRSDGEKALLLELPTFDTLLNYLPPQLDMDRALAAYEQIRQVIALKMRRPWLEHLESDRRELSPRYSVRDAGIRALRGLAMHYLAIFAEDDLRQMLASRYQSAANMTERMHALAALNQRHDRHRDEALADFHQRFADQPLVIDKWFALQAKDAGDGALARIEALAEHQDFAIGNPNRFRALVATFASQNPVLFHAKDGSGYRFVAAQIGRILTANPQLSARLLNVFAIGSRLDSERRAVISAELQALAARDGVSTDVQEVITRIQGSLQGGA
ncbi:MAG: aminopeptidase N [Cardiobacteriaceae bacterium]|nr:aminopeptidase N [Cardiobacteriaceae bacterium]